MTTRKIRTGINTSFHNKPTDLEADAFRRKGAYNLFPSRWITLPELAAHITGGGAFSVAAFTGDNRKREYFDRAYLIGLDFDKLTPGSAALLRQNPFVSRYSWLAYATPSATPEQPKMRLVFVLDRPVFNADEYENYLAALQWKFADFAPDANCKDAARFFFGSDKPGAIVNHNAELPVAVLQELATARVKALDAELEQTRGQCPARVPATGNRAARYAVKAYENTLAELAATGKGNRNSALFKTACYLLGMARGNWPGIAEGNALADLRQTAKRIGLEEHEIEATLRSAVKRATAKELTLPAQPERQPGAPKPSEKPKKSYSEQASEAVTLAALAATKRVNLPYISELETASLPASIAIKSALATGKTELIIRLIRQFGYKRVLYISHLSALDSNAVARFTAAGLGFEIYSDFAGQSAKYLSGADKIVCSYNSLPRLQKADAFDLVVCDETTQLADYTHADTFEHNGAYASYKAFCEIVHRAGKFLALDAFMDNPTCAWLRSLRPDLQVIENTYTPERGNLYLHSTKYSVIGRALAAIEAGQFPIVIPCGAKSDAQYIHRLIVDRFGGDGVLLVYKETSQSKTAQAFLRDINTALQSGAVKVLICSPSIATGVNVTAPVYGVYAVFQNYPQTAPDMLQMLMRFRNAGERHVYVKPHNGHAETDAAKIYHRKMSHAHQTAAIADFDSADLDTGNGLQAHLLQLYAAREARRNALRNKLLPTFVTMAHREGFTIEIIESLNTDARTAYSEAAKAYKEWRRNRHLDVAAIDHETLRKRVMAGTVTIDDYIGRNRDKIEALTGLSLDRDNPDAGKILDALYTGDNRDALRLYASVWNLTGDYAQRHDQAEAMECLPIARRDHLSLKTQIVRDVVKLVWSSLDQTALQIEVGADVIRERLTDYITQNRANIELLDGRNDLSADCIRTLRRVLKRAGLVLVARQVEVADKKKYMVYSVDTTSEAALFWHELAGRYATKEVTPMNAEREIVSRVRRGASKKTAYRPFSPVGTPANELWQAS